MHTVRGLHIARAFECRRSLVLGGGRKVMRWTRFVAVAVVVSSFLVIAEGVIGSRRAVAQDVQAGQEVSATSIGDTGTSSFIVSRGTEKIRAGRRTFRYDTFGDESFWGSTLKLHQAIEGSRFGGVGPGLSPRTALALGLKVSSTGLPAEVKNGNRERKTESGRPGEHARPVEAQCRAGPHRLFPLRRHASIRRHSVRTVSFHCRRLVRAGDRRTAGRV